MSTAAESVLRQIRALPIEDQQQIARELNIAPAGEGRRLEDVLGKYSPLPPDPNPDPHDHNEAFVEAIEYYKGIKRGTNGVR